MGSTCNIHLEISWWILEMDQVEKLFGGSHNLCLHMGGVGENNRGVINENFTC